MLAALKEDFFWLVVSKSRLCCSKISFASSKRNEVFHKLRGYSLINKRRTISRGFKLQLNPIVMAKAFQNMKMALGDMLSPMSDATGASRRSSRRGSTASEEGILEISFETEASDKSSVLSNRNKSKENRDKGNNDQPNR